MSVTRLGLYGGPRGPYGSFDGKTAVTALLADDVESASEVTSPAVGQEHALLADDVESASELSVPLCGTQADLLADDVESASSVSIPTLGEPADDIRVGDGGGGRKRKDDWEEHKRVSEWAAKRILEEARLEALKEAEKEAEKAQDVGVREQRKIVTRIREDLADAVRDDVTKSRIEVTDVRRGLTAITALLDERKKQKTRSAVLRYFEDIQTVIGQRIAEQEQRLEELAQARHTFIHEQNQIALRMMDEDRQQTAKKIRAVGEKLLSRYVRK